MKIDCVDLLQRLRRLATKKCSGSELKKFVPRILHRLRLSNTGEEGVIPLQVALNRSFKSKGHINKAMPNEVMWMDPNRGGLGWANLWDEISIDRIVTWIKHANSDGVESKIASRLRFIGQRDLLNLVLPFWKVNSYDHGTVR
jgi:hypothetical protein